MSLTLTILFNNVPDDARADTAWGFACLIEGGPKTVLFDAGCDGHILIENAKALNKDLAHVDAIVLSHGHWDHAGGLWDAVRACGAVEIYHPKSQGDVFKGHIAKLGATSVPVEEAFALFDGLTVTAEMGGDIKEQNLVIQGADGTVVLTGCAHPGIAEITARAKVFTGQDIDLVIGGFHLLKHKPEDVEAVIQTLRGLGVKRVAPSHCTGTDAIAAFKKTWGDDFVFAGCGTVLQVA